jgi:hypothetical protein
MLRYVKFGVDTLTQACNTFLRMTELTYIEVGKELQVHPYHVRRIVKKHPRLIQPIVRGYNRITFRLSDVKKLKKLRQQDAVKARHSAIKKIRNLSRPQLHKLIKTP